MLEPWVSEVFNRSVAQGRITTGRGRVC
jgi:hypothetical protein